MLTLSSNLRSVAGLSGTFSVLDAWDSSPSPYTITLLNGQLVAVVDASSKSIRFGLDHFGDYMAREFGLLRSIAACAYDPTARSDEDAMMLGYFND